MTSLVRRIYKTCVRKCATVFAGVADTIEVLTDHMDERFDKIDGRLADHEHRITSLEQAA
jgi:hypothetical protein